MPAAGAVGELRRPRRRRARRHAGARPDSSPGGGNGPAETAGATRPGTADVCRPGLLARRRFALPGRLAGDDATSTGAFVDSGRRLRGGAGRRRALAAAGNGLKSWHSYGYGSCLDLFRLDFDNSMRTIGVLLALTVALSAQEPQPPAELAIRVVVAGTGLVRQRPDQAQSRSPAEDARDARRADPVLRRRQAGLQRARSDRRRMRMGRRRRSPAARPARRRQPDRRRPHRRQLAHQGPRPGREGVGRRRAGHGGRDRSRPVRRRACSKARSSCSKTACRRPSATSRPKDRRSKSSSRSTSARA